MIHFRSLSLLKMILMIGSNWKPGLMPPQWSDSARWYKEYSDFHFSIVSYCSSYCNLVIKLARLISGINGLWWRDGSCQHLHPGRSVMTDRIDGRVIASGKPSKSCVDDLHCAMGWSQELISYQICLNIYGSHDINCDWWTAMRHEINSDWWTAIALS